jgi:hypothetical protein
MDAQSSLQRENKLRRLGRLAAWNMPHLDVQKQPAHRLSRAEACLHF